MHRIAIRTNFNSSVGIGHLIRMKKLAESLNKHQIIFLLDNINNFSKKIIKFKQYSIYKKNEKFESQLEDAKRTNQLLKIHRIEKIIVDDYRLNLIWEKKIPKNINILVFDDNNKSKHLCDVIVDSKWDRENTYKRYANLVTKKTIKLLGPKYAILNYKNSFKKKTKKFNLLFYIGGGGNFNYYLKFLTGISNTFKKNKKFRINVVVGPLSKNHHRLKILVKKNRNFQIIKNCLDLSNILKQTDLFIGTSSSIIYQLNYLKVPSIVFSDQKNQENNFKSLNDLGVPLIVKKEDLSKNINKICRLVELIYNKNKKLKKMIKPRILIDSLGAERIKKVFIDRKNFKNSEGYLTSYKKLDNGIFPVEDNFVNYYLDSRNLAINRKKSINKKLISNLDHYLWWFSEDIKKYFLIRKKKIRIFFNHQVIKIKSKKFYYGGWFVTSNTYQMLDIIKVIKWQIKNLSKYPWLALIQKKNKFVYSINTYLGFRKISFNKDFIKLKKFQKEKYHILIN